MSLLLAVRAHIYGLYVKLNLRYRKVPDRTEVAHADFGHAWVYRNTRYYSVQPE